MIGESTKTDDFTYENSVLRGCAPGVTRTPDPRIRNPLLYPAELRAQDLHRHIPRFAANKSARPAGLLFLLFRNEHQLQDPAAGIFCRILRERGLESLREQINHLLPVLCGALVAEVHEEARFVYRFKKTSVRFREGLGITVLLKLI